MSEEPTLDRLRVLVVDDEPDVILLFTSILERADISCEPAATGLAARKKLKATQYDVVITDLNIPGLSGLELLAEIRAQGLQSRKHQPLPVILSSGQTDSSVADLARRRGAFVLPKPFAARELVERVRSLAAGDTPPAVDTASPKDKISRRRRARRGARREKGK
jgi:DNA-binding response OmpR family regulator